MRTVTQDAAVRDNAIAEGESVLLDHVSASRGEDVFVNPFRLDVRRGPNRHLAFEHDVPFCLAAALARMEIDSFFSELMPRLTTAELAGTPEFLSTMFVGAIKHVPIRDELD